MYRALLLGLAMLLLGSRVGFSTEQTVEPIVPRGEQVVQPLASPGEQVVERMGTTEEQQVGIQEPPSTAAKVASTAGKVVTGVAAAGVSLGAMAAMLLLL